MIGLWMFVATFCALFLGFPVAFTFGGMALLFSIISFFYENGFATLMQAGGMGEMLSSIFDMFSLMPFRIMSIMENVILMAIPLFIFMGIILQKAKLAERLLQSMGVLFGNIRGGLAVSTVLVGGLLAASTGVVGASVVSMGIISLPIMMKYKYNKALATGTICASGTLGQIIPPSIVLILLGDVLNISVGDLFKAAVIPGMSLVFCYILFILGTAFFFKKTGPIVPASVGDSSFQKYMNALKAIIPPLGLIFLVLGSIFASIATPTESSAIGGVGAVILAIIYKEFNWKMLWDAAKETVKITSMVFAIFVGATAFSMVFTYTGADAILEEIILSMPGGTIGFVLLVMAFIFVLGFFIDFVEICFVIVPILYPLAEALGIDMIWFAILIAINLQTSFLTPPFGFSLFYLKGIAPPEIKTSHIYRGVIPFIGIQVIVLVTMIFYPSIFGF